MLPINSWIAVPLGCFVESCLCEKHEPPHQVATVRFNHLRSRQQRSNVIFHAAKRQVGNSSNNSCEKQNTNKPGLLVSAGSLLHILPHLISGASNAPSGHISPSSVRRGRQGQKQIAKEKEKNDLFQPLWFNHKSWKESVDFLITDSRGWRRRYHRAATFN